MKVKRIHDTKYVYEVKRGDFNGQKFVEVSGEWRYSDGVHPSGDLIKLDGIPVLVRWTDSRYKGELFGGFFENELSLPDWVLRVIAIVRAFKKDNGIDWKEDHPDLDVEFAYHLKKLWEVWIEIP